MESDMSYTINRILEGEDMAGAEARARVALAGQGFGVLSEIDVQATMQAKLGEDMSGYKILGACNPKLAFEAIGIEPRVGAMLPCNVILRAVDGGVEVSAVDPVVSMSGIDNAGLATVAGGVREMLATAVAAL